MGFSCFFQRYAISVNEFSSAMCRVCLLRVRTDGRARPHQLIRHNITRSGCRNLFRELDDVESESKCSFAYIFDCVTHLNSPSVVGIWLCSSPHADFKCTSCSPVSSTRNAVASLFSFELLTFSLSLHFFQLLLQQLLFIEVGVDAATLHKFFVCSPFDDLAV